MHSLFDDCNTLGENRSNLPVGLWRSWERASMAWKRSSVRSRPGPPSLFKSGTSRATERVPACREGRRFDPDQVHHTLLQYLCGFPALLSTPKMSDFQAVSHSSHKPS